MNVTIKAPTREIAIARAEHAWPTYRVVAIDLILDGRVKEWRVTLEAK